MKKIILLSGSLSLLLLTMSMTQQQEDPWKVPEKYEKMKNPVAADAVSLKAGKTLYQDHCMNCHGPKGKGDGIKAATLKHAPSDFTTAAFQQQTDGSLLYKIYFGHKDMPGFKNRIPDNKDVIDGAFGKTRTPGDLINYIRTLATK